MMLLLVVTAISPMQRCFAKLPQPTPRSPRRDRRSRWSQVRLTPQHVAGMSLRRRGQLALGEVRNFADMLRRVHQLEADPFAMPAGRKAPALDDRYLVRHVGMLRIMRDAIYAGFRHDLAGTEFLSHLSAPS